MTCLRNYPPDSDYSLSVLDWGMCKRSQLMYKQGMTGTWSYPVLLLHSLKCKTMLYLLSACCHILPSNPICKACANIAPRSALFYWKYIEFILTSQNVPDTLQAYQSRPTWELVWEDSCVSDKNMSPTSSTLLNLQLPKCLMPAPSWTNVMHRQHLTHQINTNQAAQQNAFRAW